MHAPIMILLRKLILLLLLYMDTCIHTPYYIAGKFGGELHLAVWRSDFATAKLKSTNIFRLHITICMVIPYQIAKFESANIFAMAIWGSTANRQI